MYIDIYLIFIIYNIAEEASLSITKEEEIEEGSLQTYHYISYHYISFFFKYIFHKI